MKKLAIALAALSLTACDPAASPDSPHKAPDKTTVNSAAPAGDVFPQAPPPSNRNGKTNPSDDQVIAHDAVVPSEGAPPVADRPAAPPSKPAADAPATTTPDFVPSKPEGRADAPTQPRPDVQVNQCAEPVRETRPEWAPGVTYPVAEKPVFTEPANESGPRYTDVRRDDMFAVALERANAVPKEMKEGNSLFAKQIRDVKVSVDMIHTREVKVRVLYQFRMEKATIELRGVMEKPLNVTLAQVPLPGAPKDAQNFSGILTCADAEKGCKNIILRLDLRSKDNKIARSAFIVHRWGEAHIKMSDMDRRGFAKVPNQNLSAFLEYVSNSLNNACLSTLADIKNGRREIPLCAQQRLEAQCGSEEMKKPAARAIGLRSWAVANGKAAFELVMTGKDYDGVQDLDAKRTPYLSVRGPLVYSKSVPAFAHPLIVGGQAKGLNEVYLMNNDGGGNLNLRFDFGAAQDEKSRLSVSSLLPNSAYSQSVVQAAQSLPSVPQADVEQQDLVD